jgi:putative redox protein
MDLITVTAGNAGSTIAVRAHRLGSDHSQAEGGTDAGPSPAELFVASLGSCMALAVSRYCRTRGYGELVEVNLTYTMAKEPNRIDSIVIDLRAPADLPEDRLDAIRRVAEKCPLHATLAMPPQIDLDIVRA